MKSIFRLYARTTKGNQQYLQDELLRFGLQPKYQDQFHAFYFKANFTNLMQLSFKSMSIQSLYIQLGHKFGAGTDKLVKEGFQKIPFGNYLPLHQNLLSQLTLNIIIRESTNLSSNSVFISLLKQHLQKQIITKQYKQNIAPYLLSHNSTFQEIKSIVQRKWNIIDQSKQNLLQQSKIDSKQLSQAKSTNYIDLGNEQNSNHYSPLLTLYVRKNLGRILLQVNKQQMYKYGWRKAISWGSIRQSIVASIMHRTGLFQDAVSKNKLSLWDPFCGSGTIPIVASCLCSNTMVRQDYLNNFNWPYWKIYKQQYLDYYLGQQQNQSYIQYQIIGSDISLKAINISIANFRNLLPNLKLKNLQSKSWFSYQPIHQVYEMVPNQVYFVCEHFNVVMKQMLIKSTPLNILTNLPYLYGNSSQHHPINQIVSAYKKFDNMLRQYSSIIQNAYIIVGIDTIYDNNHFLKISKENWLLLEEFNSGGVKIGLYGWAKNKLSYIMKQQTSIIQFTKPQIPADLLQYRKKVGLPEHLKISRKKGIPIHVQKAKERHLKSDYSLFSKRRDLAQAYQQYIASKTKTKMMKRGQKWKSKNLSLLKLNPQKYSLPIKQQFEQRIKYALIRKQRQINNKQPKVKRKW